MQHARGGWWHDYVCPTHGTELEPRSGDAYPCRYGCRLTGEPFASAWTVYTHQAGARRARLLAHRHTSARARGVVDTADRNEAVHIVTEFAEVYADIAAAGWSTQSEPWMLRGKLFAQALTEAIWAVQLADAVAELATDDVARPALGAPVVSLLTGLLATITSARQTLVVDKNDPTSNYVAWIDAAGTTLNRALLALGHVDDGQDWVARTVQHARLAIGADGWEWEGSTYYHLFVLRAYLLALRGTEPAALHADAFERLADMVRVLADLAAPDGTLPMLHDGPYDRVPAHLEVLEVCVLARQLWADSPLDAVEAAARRSLGDAHDGLEDLLTGWFGGPALPAPTRGATPAGPRPSALFANAGYAVLRDPGDTWQAVLDAGPHGGSHGHLDKLGLYFYGTGVAWQPAPGVPPYASTLRRGYYARTLAHPTVRVDDLDQLPTTGQLEDFSATRVVASAGDAIAGVFLRRELVMTDDYLLDIVHAVVDDPTGDTDTPRDTNATGGRRITLALRPAVPLTVTAEGGAWRTTWAASRHGDPTQAEPGAAELHGFHRATAPAVLLAAPGRGPSDDPARTLTIADWTVTGHEAWFVSVYAPGTAVVRDVVLHFGAAGLTIVTVLLADERSTDHRVTR
ncbi:heparinase II/III family protein [Cryobacterium sp. PAMC25264]|uniref:heparinase II/III domain-containing protein n=1 Tax=Cryobacterium sp. PAMC25264 TaxID=2861288 RepID=UPI001C62AB91|nr:heparinase II/III family protein [Cryobacterium sp. PAMC25264]QYF74523.1 heparinase II/III family protein [Cryobacterium sp. PAMC25264]